MRWDKVRRYGRKWGNVGEMWEKVRESKERWVKVIRYGSWEQTNRRLREL